MSVLPDPLAKPLLTVAELASFMPQTVGEKAIRSGIESGQISHVRVGRYILIPTVELYRLGSLSPDMREPGLAGPGIATNSTREEEADAPDRTLRTVS